PTLHYRPMQTGKLIMEHQIQNEFGVAPIVLLPPTSPAADLGGMAEPDLATQFLEHSFEPWAVTTCFQAHDYLPNELGVESPHLLFVLVLQLMKDEFASFSFQITNGLLSCMKVNADIYCLHSASFQSPSKGALSLLKAGGACFITSVPRAVATGSPPIARIEIARTVTRSLQLSVLTSSSNSGTTPDWRNRVAVGT